MGLNRKKASPLAGGEAFLYLAFHLFQISTQPFLHLLVMESAVFRI